MADKPDQIRLKTKKPFKNKSAIRIPISLHFYAVEIVVIILAAFIMDIYIQSLVQSFISQECTARLDEAVASTKSFFENGRWKPKDRAALYKKAYRQMLDRCLTPENKQRACENGEAQFRRMMTALGYSHVAIRWQE